MAQTLDQFTSAWNGKYADFDGWYGAQCVDIVNFYQRDVVGGSFISAVGAKDWFEKYSTNGASAKYDKIVNNMADPNQLPSRGDVVVWSGALSGSGGYGHIGVVLSANKSGFTSFDQNFPSGSYCHSQYHAWTSTVLGWLHPKANGAPAPAPAPTPAPTTSLWVRVFGDYRTLYRSPGSGQFARITPNAFGGHLDYRVVERSGDFTKIHTSYYGAAWIYTGASVANLTQFYQA